MRSPPSTAASDENGVHFDASIIGARKVRVARFADSTQVSETAWVGMAVSEETGEDLRRIRPSRSGEMLLNPTRALLVSNSFTVTCVTAIALVTGSACLAQVAGGTISGSVRDSSGRAIAGAQVAVKNSKTAILRSIDTDSDGIYTAPNLVAGTYQISASKEGFATLVRSGVLVTVGSEEVIDFKLNPGEVKTEIEVSGTPPAIQLASSTLEATENSTTVRELPLNGRDCVACRAHDLDREGR